MSVQLCGQSGVNRLRQRVPMHSRPEPDSNNCGVGNLSASRKMTPERKVSMIDKVFVDFGRTFGSGVFLGVEPKMARKDKNDPKSEQVQARDNDGNLKWAAAIAVKVQGFGKSKQEVLSVTLSSPT